MKIYTIFQGLSTKEEYKISQNFTLFIRINIEYFRCIGLHKMYKIKLFL